MAKDRGLLEICDSRIGEVFAYDPYGYDLQLMSSVKDVGAIPIAGKRLIILALVAQNLYFRIFDSDGKMVVDTDAKRLTERRGGPIEDLKERLESLWPPTELAEGERDPGYHGSHINRRLHSTSQRNRFLALHPRERRLGRDR